MTCPKCGIDQTCVRDTFRTDRTVERWRECRVCGTRFRTWEVYLNEYKSIKLSAASGEAQRHRPSKEVKW